MLSLLRNNRPTGTPSRLGSHRSSSHYQPGSSRASLTVDTDPVRSPDAEPPATTPGPLKKEGEGYVLHTDVEEVVLNATVLEGNRWSQT